MTESETEYVCPECHTDCNNAPGIGPYCPAEDCPVADRAIEKEQVTNDE